MRAGTSTSRKPASARSVSANGVLRARPALKNRPLLSFVQGVKVAALFKLLGNDTRVRLLHHIVRCGEATVTDMAAKLGMKPQAVSNQLVRLSDGPSGGKRPPAGFSRQLPCEASPVLAAPVVGSDATTAAR